MTDARPSRVPAPFACALDLFVYAPVGAILAVRRHLPGFVDAGRERVQTQVRVARMVGEFAVRIGRDEMGRRVERVVERLTATEHTPSPTATVPVHPDAEPPTTSPPTTGQPAAGRAAKPGPKRSTRRSAEHSAGPAAEAVATVTPLRRVPEAADLPIRGYDSLAASQVVDRLASLSVAELAHVREYETAHRRRRTVLHRIEQLVG